MKKIVLLFFIVFSLTNVVLADFTEEELPVWGMFSETAYSLNKGEWNLDTWGGITYGITNRFQVGSVFWAWWLQIPNIFVKYTIIEESDLPAISVGGVVGKYDSGQDDSYFAVYGLSLFVSKKMSPDLYLSGSYKYMDVDSSIGQLDEGTIFNFGSAVGLHVIVADVIHEMSPKARMFGEVAGLINSNHAEMIAGGGFEWAMVDDLRMKMGVYLMPRGLGMKYWPFVDMHWRFK